MRSLSDFGKQMVVVLIQTIPNTQSYFQRIILILANLLISDRAIKNYDKKLDLLAYKVFERISTLRSSMISLISNAIALEVKVETKRHL